MDVVLAVLLFVGAALYLSALPYNLNAADESYFLYEAKRVRDGEVMYRDVFEFATPLAAYAMAGLFWLFGTSMATARISMAFLHALTGVLLYATSRQLGVRRELALAVPLAYLAVCQAVWPFASWHWFSTLFATAVLLSMVAGPWATRPRWMVVPGLLNGFLICVQQQKGVALAAGTGAVLVADFLVDRRYPDPGSWRALATRLAYLAAGVAVVVGPVLLAFTLLAGVQPLYDVLVRFPLENYRPSFRSAWGAVAPLSSPFAEYTFPTVSSMHRLPCCCRSSIGRRANRRAPGSTGRQASVGVDRPVRLLRAVDSLFPRRDPHRLRGGSLLDRRRAGPGVGARRRSPACPHAPHRGRGRGAARFGPRFPPVRNARLLSGQFPVSHETAFGRVDFADRWEPVLLDKARQLVAETPSQELFCYPYLSLPYLVTGARNPTPYQYLMSGVSPDQHIKNTLAILDAHRVPYIVGSLFFLQRDDPIAQYIKQHYEFVPIPEMVGVDELPSYWIYARKTPSVCRGRSLAGRFTSRGIGSGMSASNRESRSRTAGGGFRIDWADGLLAAGVLVGTVAYLSRLPHNLSPADESVYLYQAKRILAGEVLYRDVFEITTPGWM